MTKPIFILSLFAFVLTGNISAQYISDIQATKTGIHHVSARDFYQSINKVENPQILDIRTSREYAGGHIKGAVLIDYYNPNFARNIEKAGLDKNQPVFVYCRSGNRSGHAMSIFKKAGFKNVYNLQYGIKDWVRNRLPLERGMPSHN